MIEIKVLDQKWKVYLQEEDTYVRQWGDADVAHTIPVTREIYFNEEELSRVAVVHELGHAYYAEMCVSSANLTVDQVEEVFCEMLGNYGDKILRLGRRLYKELKNESGD